MKLFTQISALLNVLLLGWVIAEKYHPRQSAAESASQVLPSNEISKRSLNPDGSQPPPFRWSQIESTNYPVYVANLRAIGCPEQTIRDIIVADVASLYASIREQFIESHSNAESEAVRESLEELRAEENSLVASLLGAQPPGERSPEPIASTWVTARIQRTSASMPLVFKNVDFNSLKLYPAQTEAIYQLRARFLAEIGDPNDSSAYRERWQKAQPRADEMLRGFIGVNAFQDYQLAATAISESEPANP